MDKLGLPLSLASHQPEGLKCIEEMANFQGLVSVLGPSVSFLSIAAGASPVQTLSGSACISVSLLPAFQACVFP